MNPYRTEERETHAEAPRDPGIVGDVIAQFADPLAFFRELVQNAIDAGTPEVEVRIEHDEGAGVVRASVRDRGEGMTREIIEEQLLVLFRSTKERDETKIGKFGIGFASVLSPAPRIVVVQTARDGRRLALHLHPDLTYQLFDAGPATKPGTAVTLELPMPAPAAVVFAQQSREALVRWCRHAAVPIRLEAEVAAAGLRHAERIDRPLAIEGALVEVRAATDDGRLVAVVGIPLAGAPPYAGFFNHGLMLHETEEPLLGRLAVKLQDPRLGHTLSRDNVRRDERFEHAVGFARQLAERQLPAAAAAALREAAVTDLARYAALAAAVGAAGVALRAEEWTFPLVEEVRGERAISGAALGGKEWSAPAPGPLSAALARAGIPVLHAAGGAVAAQARAFGCRVVSIEDELTSVTPVAAKNADADTDVDTDVVLLEALRGALAAAHRAPSAISLAHLSGACWDHLAVAGGPGAAIRPIDPDAPDAPYVIDRAAALASPFALLRRPQLVLSAEHPIVAAARRRADPALAASHLARAVLLYYRLLDEERAEALLSRALDDVGAP